MRLLRVLLLCLVVVMLLSSVSLYALKDNSKAISNWFLKNSVCFNMMPIHKGFLRASLYFDKGNASSYFYLARAYSITGDFSEAYENYKEALAHQFKFYDMVDFAFAAEKVGKCDEFKALMKAAGHDQANYKFCHDSAEEAR